MIMTSQSTRSRLSMISHHDINLASRNHCAISHGGDGRLEISDTVDDNGVYSSECCSLLWSIPLHGLSLQDRLWNVALLMMVANWQAEPVGSGGVYLTKVEARVLPWYLLLEECHWLSCDNYCQLCFSPLRKCSFTVRMELAHREKLRQGWDPNKLWVPGPGALRSGCTSS